MLVEHPLQPKFDSNSRVLILGTMPSPKSREIGFYYGHPQNRFWRILAELFDEPLPSNNKERTDFVLVHRIALWDVLASCEIEGASDSSIRNAVPNDLARVLEHAPVRAIFTTGGKAKELFDRHLRESAAMDAIALPSTSAANARMRLPQLVDAYRILLDYLQD
ncbi:MAG: DNA-deoxyinosine glycosylase [Coriobacteriales bacterium]|nr:DNA-deoxyinosine glycosylase [Coriobacteriales bacterium]